MKRIIILLMFVLGTFCQQIKEIEFEELKNGLDNGSLILIDVRSRDELKNDGKIPKSLNIPSPELEKTFQMSNEDFYKKVGHDKPQLNDKIVFSCRSGKRAQAALKKIQNLNLGYTNLILYRGSFNDWKVRGGPIE